MKKLILIFTFLPILTIGQNWSPSGAVWYYGFSAVFDAGYYKIEYIGDTIINSIQCKELRKTLYHENLTSQTFDTTIIGTEYTYADADKVYLFKHNQFYTLYDFSAQVGSIWIVPEIKRYNGCDTTGTIQVDSIGIMNINGQNLRYICVSPTNTLQQWGWDVKIVERIGPIQAFSVTTYDYLFPQKYNFCGMAIDELIEGGGFRCYSDNSPFSFTTNISPTCDFITSIKSMEIDSNQANVFPNPSKGSFTLVIENTINAIEIQLTDLFGNLVLQKHFENQSIITLNTPVSGTFILKIIQKDKIILCKKILAQ